MLCFVLAGAQRGQVELDIRHFGDLAKRTRLAYSFLAVHGRCCLSTVHHEQSWEYLFSIFGCSASWGMYLTTVR